VRYCGTISSTSAGSVRSVTVSGTTVPVETVKFTLVMGSTFCDRMVRLIVVCCCVEICVEDEVLPVVVLEPLVVDWPTSWPGRTCSHWPEPDWPEVPDVPVWAWPELWPPDVPEPEAPEPVWAWPEERLPEPEPSVWARLGAEAPDAPEPDAPV
jgi:hypothetical protein